jgi:hypothetical protein
MIHVIAFTATLLACLAYVLTVGGKPERLAILAQLAAFLLTVIILSFRWTPFEHFPVALALVDVLLAAILTLLALKANRLWPIILAGMQVATVFAHLAKALGFPLPAAGYAIFVQFWGWPMLIVTAVGAYKHRARIRRFGEEPDWKPFWPHSVRARLAT